ncbi:hypothetical protein CEXT_380721 [Caerostris extrusa]|uniref:Uncharacterized protein n=1 Tax=Caerostris extrusa TaxID=172846 RepID=A0AAV4TP52_CAEEX|nr:hypothetical protein CEXT_380721 [Caerostris extrusa]
MVTKLHLHYETAYRSIKTVASGTKLSRGLGVSICEGAIQEEIRRSLDRATHNNGLIKNVDGYEKIFLRTLSENNEANRVQSLIKFGSKWATRTAMNNRKPT